MNTEQALLQAILAEPDNDEVRLIYADWLEEHGNVARAEFIRIQLDLAGLPAHNPRWPMLWAREQLLLERHQSEWTPKVRYGVFRRGFVEGVTFYPQEFVTQGAAVFQLAPVRHGCFDDVTVHFHHEDGEDFYEDHTELLAASPLLARLAGLELRERGDGWRFGNFRAVNYLSAAQLERLLASPHWADLRTLILQSGLSAEAGEVIARVPSLRNLRTLELPWNRLGVAGVRALTRAPTLANLTQLDLSSNQASDPAVGEFLATSTYLTQLTHLNLSGNGIGDEGVALLASARSLGSLRDLNLSATRLTQAGLRALVQSPHWAELESLRLRSHHFSDDDFRILLDWPPERRLLALDVAANQLSDQAFVALAQSGLLGHLARLELGLSHQVSAAGVRALVASPQVRGLKWLGLEQCRLDDASAAALACSPHLTGLVVLNLHQNKISDDGARALMASPYLTSLLALDLDSNAMSMDSWRALQAHFGPVLRRIWPGN